MKTWKAASALFQGGTQQVNSLKGKRVRSTSVLTSARVYDPIYNRPDTATIECGKIGFVSNPLGNELLIAYPKQEHTQIVSLDALMRNCMFLVVVVNGSTFKDRFEVEVSAVAGENETGTGAQSDGYTDTGIDDSSEATLESNCNGLRVTRNPFSSLATTYARS